MSNIIYNKYDSKILRMTIDSYNHQFSINVYYYKVLQKVTKL